MGSVNENYKRLIELRINELERQIKLLTIELKIKKEKILELNRKGKAKSI